MSKITMTKAIELYREGNNMGVGYTAYVDELGAAESIDSTIAAAERDGWVMKLWRHTSEEVAVLENGDSELMAIGGDAMGRNPWTGLMADRGGYEV